METWPKIAFTKCIVKHGVNRTNQINSSEVKTTGMFPVVDQGQSFIAGYTDDNSKPIRDGFPYVIFGDHTRCFKYVDFPFVLGADGTKVLKPDPDAFSARFFYYAMLSLDIPSRGYNHHFKFVKEKSIPKPPLPEQRRIAAVLSLVQRAIEQQDRLIALTTELKKALMHKLFTEGTRGEPQKQTEIGPIPESWEIVRLGDVATLKSGGTPSRKNNEYWNNGTIRWVKTGEVDYCIVKDTAEKITLAGLVNSSAKMFPSGTLIMAMYGQGITRGKVAILGAEAATNQACVAFFPAPSLKTKFLYYFFEYKYEEIRNLSHGANQKNLSADILKACEIVFPADLDEQNSISESLSTLDTRIDVARKMKTQLQDLFRTLLHRLMTAETRVNDLDLEALGLDSENGETSGGTNGKKARAIS